MVRLSSFSRKYKLTHDIVKSHTSIPVPRVLDWACDENNSVGAEYIIIEHAGGVNFTTYGGRWIPISICSLRRPLQRLPRKWLISHTRLITVLYFDDIAIGLKRKIDFANGFVIGPSIGTVSLNGRKITIRDRQTEVLVVFNYSVSSDNLNHADGKG